MVACQYIDLITLLILWGGASNFWLMYFGLKWFTNMILVIEPLHNLFLWIYNNTIVATPPLKYKGYVLKFSTGKDIYIHTHIQNVTEDLCILLLWPFANLGWIFGNMRKSLYSGWKGLSWRKNSNFHYIILYGRFFSLAANWW